MAESKPERKPKVNLHIDRKKKRRKPDGVAKERKRKVKAKKRIAFKASKLKLVRTTSKLKTFVRKAMKSALKGKNVPAKVYKRADIAIAKSEAIKNALQAAIVDCVNAIYTAPTSNT